jgi:RNA-binding protein
LKPLGELSFITKSRHILIRTKQLPDIYSFIATKDKRKVGKVSDIIGPVMDPHVVVRPTEEVLKNPDIIKGKELFELPSKARRSKHGRKKSRIR